jgi:hypothetical protein
MLHDISEVVYLGLYYKRSIVKATENFVTKIWGHAVCFTRKSSTNCTHLLFPAGNNICIHLFVSIKNSK